MSYSLMFSITPIPEDDSEAWDEFDEREEENEDLEKPPHPLMVKLIETLMEKYPCISTLSDEEVDNTIWSDGPLMSNIIGDLCILAVSFSKVEEALPFIKETAKNLGLVFYDGQEEVIYRP